MTVTGRRMHLTAIASLLLVSGGVSHADEGVPALLQFAEQYQGQEGASSAPTDNAPLKAPSSTSTKKPSAPHGGVEPKAGAGHAGTSLRQALRQRELQLGQQQVTLRAQASELAALRAELKALNEKKAQDVPAAPMDFSPVYRLVSGLREAASGTPDQKRSTELLTLAHQQLEQEKAALAQSQSQVSALSHRLAALQSQGEKADKTAGENARRVQSMQVMLTDLQSRLDEKEQALAVVQQRERGEDAQHSVQAKALADAQARLDALATARQAQENVLAQQKDVLMQKDSQLATLNAEKLALQTQYEALQQKSRQADTQLAALTRDKQELEGDISDLSARAKGLVKPETLKQPAVRQAYAAGTALGKDILGLLEERQGLGVTIDRQTVLAGVIDAFSGQYQLTSDVLAKALGESEATIRKAQAAVVAGQQKSGDSYIEKFSRQVGVKRAPGGFWYKVEYAGDAPIVGDAIVDVVVKESLTDGTVIQDMDLSGNVLSQPLSAYPPLFKEAIGLLKNHGSMTLVVPPELAYGEAGYPPKVPPNATMVYVLRVEDSKAATDGVVATPAPTKR